METRRRLGIGRLREMYWAHIGEGRRERLFLTSLAFFVAFGLSRLVTVMIRANVGPFHNTQVGGTHVHHLVYGIALLLLTGYLWLILADSRHPGVKAQYRLMAVAFGIGAALTLDEFALWLNLQDVYWTEKGAASIDAVILFGAALSVWFWGAPLIHAILKEIHLIVREAIRLERFVETELNGHEPDPKA